MTTKSKKMKLSEVEKLRGMTREKRNKLQKLLKEINTTLSDNLESLNGTKQLSEDSSSFPESLYDSLGKNEILEPPYSFDKLYKIYEESDVLQTCINAYVTNIDGFGHLFEFTGDDITQKDTPEMQMKRQMLEDFFTQVNDRESFRSIRKSVRKDLEILGNGGFEIIRNAKNEIALMYALRFKTIRLIKLKDENPVPIVVKLRRNGKLTEIKTYRYFRKYVQVNPTKTKIRWFKEYGDPRVMDALTGEYVKKGKKPKVVASEILHLKNQVSNEVYGIPRWIGAMLQVLGRRGAQFVNYDLFQTQGIPPLFITVSGGQLTDDSFDYLENLLQSLRGMKNWNRITLLEAFTQSYGLDEKPGNAKIDIVDASKFRKEDLMFSNYLKISKADVRHVYRLSDLYIGESETYTHSTAKAAQVVCEAQVFNPEREDFDEIINNRIIQQGFGIREWVFKTKGPRIVGAAEISEAVKIFGNQGAFTINNAIQQANSAFATQMSEFDADWAKYPIPIVMELLKSGRISIPELEQNQITNTLEEINNIQNNTTKQKKSFKTNTNKDESSIESDKNLQTKLNKIAKITGVMAPSNDLIKEIEEMSLGPKESLILVLLTQLGELLKKMQ